MTPPEEHLVACAQCGKETHGVYWTSFWQVTHKTVGANPDGTSIASTPFAAVACSKECLIGVLTDA